MYKQLSELKIGDRFELEEIPGFVYFKITPIINQIGERCIAVRERKVDKVLHFVREHYFTDLHINTVVVGGTDV